VSDLGLNKESECATFGDPDPPPPERGPECVLAFLKDVAGGRKRSPRAASSQVPPAAACQSRRFSAYSSGSPRLSSWATSSQRRAAR
jgi:hypothetical protein